MNDLREQQGLAGPDGLIRGEEAEERINIAFRGAFAGPNGKLALDYLRSITLNTVLPATATDAELRMQEGMRRLFGIINTRANSTPKES
ncbi:hypothetical protein ACFSM0_16480 [Rhodobacter lacus]|uniref:Uncharacterized protein n=1 Tax=Rhodobacter lacus TaxID=1641972 RepID=A0ABW5ABI0_9RHOB